MILVTVGTNEQPFDRLVRAAAMLAGDEPLTVQHGASRVEPGRGRWVDFLSFEELTGLVEQADAVVCHAGVGSIMLAHRYGKRPLVMPRRFHLREAVDDHQLLLARRLAAGGLVDLVENEEDLPRALARRHLLGVAAAAPDLPGAANLAEDVRGYLQKLVAA